jgi:cytochrome P450 family 628
MNTSHWSTLIAYDTMGKVGFSEDWGAVKDGRENPILHLLEATFTPLGKMGRWTWPLSVMVDVLDGSPEQRLFKTWATDTIINRIKRKDIQGDVAAPIIKAYHDAGASQQGHFLLEAESQAILIAASDTVSNMLSWIFYYTARDQQLQERLRMELEPFFKGEKEPSNRELESIPLLNGIINEAMRLEPSVSLGSPRQTPPEGIMIGDQFVPGDVTVFVIQRALHRGISLLLKPPASPLTYENRCTLLPRPPLLHPRALVLAARADKG